MLGFKKTGRMTEDFGVYASNLYGYVSSTSNIIEVVAFNS
ncbi:MAG: hypothetical protein ACJA2Y_000306 [Cycloclasticus pugetii]|jgi:hypothetical protein|uniref:Uncharacterized protein n=1 Tax=Cycloclasticus zancles 78-ME TaxID=1198232 RepID=S5TUM0_9GAMM|nr:hypothetical protein CYCME_0378 [Cycloclasticus zancles 78-ME]